ncbi:MAG: CNNM domain-containing protein [bacterium]
MGLLIAYITIALATSFLCSLMEAVLLSLTPTYIGTLQAAGHPLGDRLRAYKDDIDRPLAAILSLNTVAHTVGAAGAGAQAQAIWGDEWLALASAILTLLILILSEIIPKTLGATHWRPLAPFVGRVLGPVLLLTWPLVKLSELVTRLLTGGERPAHMSREEFEALADIGRRHGLIDDTEATTLRHILRFGRLRAEDAMTPRTVMLTLDAEHTVGEVIDTHPDLRFSRIPLCGEDADEILGYVLKDELLLAAAQGRRDTPLTALRRDIRIYPHDARLADLFPELLKAREHIALIVDGYGGTAGLITLEDLVETLLGMEIVDEVDHVRDMQALAKKRWWQRARRLGLRPADAPPHDAEPPPDPGR